jgi:hypothetical protein
VLFLMRARIFAGAQASRMTPPPTARFPILLPISQPLRSATSCRPAILFASYVLTEFTADAVRCICAASPGCHFTSSYSEPLPGNLSPAGCSCEHPSDCLGRKRNDLSAQMTWSAGVPESA